MEAHESNRRLEDYPHRLVAMALRRWQIILPLLDIEHLTREAVRLRVLEVKSNLYRTGKPRIAVSIASIYRWIRLVRQSNGDVRSLIPHVRRGENRLRLNPMVEEVTESVIQQMHRVGRHATIDIIHQTIAHHLDEINTTRLEY